MMRHSNQRDLILNIVQGSHSHPSADWVYNELRKELPHVSLGTVYRNLGQLVENKLLIAINIDGTIHYDAILDKHQHFQCKTCNSIYDVKVNIKDCISRVESKTNHIIDKYKIHFVGICKDCQNN